MSKINVTTGLVLSEGQTLTLRLLRNDTTGSRQAFIEKESLLAVSIYIYKTTAMHGRFESKDP